MRPALVILACFALLQACATAVPPATAPAEAATGDATRARDAGPMPGAGDERPDGAADTVADTAVAAVTDAAKDTDVPSGESAGTSTGTATGTATDDIPPPAPGGADARPTSESFDGTAAGHAESASAPTPAALPPTPLPMAARADDIPALCEELGGLLGSVSVDACLASDLMHGDTHSHEGRALAWVEFPAPAPGAPRILVIGGIHGDEYSSISMVFRWIERLREEHAGDRSWRLVPAANPDGLLGARPARRTNARGVDLNRNFATSDWAREAETWWIEETRRDPRRRPGTAPASEVETRWLQTLISRWRPDVIVAIHAPHALLDFDASTRMSVEAPQRLGFLQLQPLGTFPGSLGRYGSLTADVPVLTLELPWAGIMPSTEDQTALWQDLAQWLGTHLPPTRAGERLTGP